MANELEIAFDERLLEVAAYLDFLQELETAAQSGAPRFGTSGGALTAQQINILRAGIYVQLYNLIEATMTKLLDALAAATCNGRWKASDLIPDIRREWVKVMTGVHKELNADNRLANACVLVEFLMQAQPLQQFKIEKGGGGNWNDSNIENFLGRVGLRLNLPLAATTAAKRRFRDDMGPLALVVKLRNDLAHGSLSFAECGAVETASGLREIVDNTTLYLRSVVQAVQTFIDNYEFLEERHRPLPIAAA
ncbi:MAG: MAE_28990/MAE_18760 family HEPN-like nuclease [Pseudomonadota bacterium]